MANSVLFLSTTRNLSRTTSKALRTKIESVGTTSKPLRTTSRFLRATRKHLRTTRRPLRTTSASQRTSRRPLAIKSCGQLVRCCVRLMNFLTFPTDCLTRCRLLLLTINDPLFERFLKILSTVSYRFSKEFPTTDRLKKNVSNRSETVLIR